MHLTIHSALYVSFGESPDSLIDYQYSNASEGEMEKRPIKQYICKYLLSVYYYISIARYS